MMIPVTQIRLPEKDLRAHIDLDALDELADSMRQRGQLQAIGILQTGQDQYEVIYGARRLRAAMILEWPEIRADIITDGSDGNTAADKLIENVQRENLSPIEEAYGLFELIGDGAADIRLLQRQTGKSKAWIKGRLELLDLPEEIQGAIQGNHIPLAVARVLATIENEDMRNEYLRHAIDSGVSAETAQYWANQAEFAEIGIVTMQQSEDLVRRMQEEPQFIEQKANCVCCHTTKTYRELSMINICKICLERVNPQRDSPDYSPQQITTPAN